MIDKLLKIIPFDIIFLSICIYATVVFTVDNYAEMRAYILDDRIDYAITEGEIVVSKYVSKGARRVSVDGFDIRYKYVVDGRTYESDQVEFRRVGGAWREYLNKYPVGKKVTVYYEKTDPEFSVLEPVETSAHAFFGPFLFLSATIFMFLTMFDFKWTRAD